MITGTCHCGNVKFELSVQPRHLTDCNCSICRKLATLWAHADKSDIKIICKDDALLEYSWGDKSIAFCTCAKCGCTTHWKSLDSDSTRMAVNVRMAEPDSLLGIQIRHFDGADSFEFLD